MISNCTCKHQAQDNLHGKGNRVFNVNTQKAPDGKVNATCTVCESSKDLKK